MRMGGSGNITFTIHRHHDVPPSLDSAIREMLAVCFPHEREHYSRDRTWRSEPSWIITGTANDGRLAAHMAVVEREVTVGDAAATVRVFGPQSVCVIPEMRGHGLASGMMTEAAGYAAEAGIRFGLLFARAGLREKVYAPLGWRVLNVRVFIESGDGGTVLRTRPSMPMVLEPAGAAFPDGDIRLNGLDW